MIEWNALWAGVVAYVLAGTVAVFGAVLKKDPQRTVLALLVAGLVLHTLAIALRWARLGHGPYVTMFEILSSNLWSLTLIYAITYWRLPSLRPLAAVVLPLLFTMMGWLILADREEGALPATYHTVWLFIHIGFSKVFSGCLLIAVGTAVVVLLRRAGAAGPRLARFPDDARLHDLGYRFMALAFIFETLMLIAGAIWAQDAWGRYWAWDPLETWSFLTWLLLAGALHARAAFRVTPGAGAVMIVAVFVVAFLTFFGIPLVSQVPHQGAV